jgi:hypothetical protein
MTISLANLQLVLPDITTKKRALLEDTNTGKTYLPLLTAHLQSIDDLPVTLKPGTPKADELEERDTEHDGYGGAVWYMVEAYVRCPGTTDDIRAAAERIRAQFIPILRELNGSFADEAKRARDREAVLADFKDDLKLFPVADKGGKKTLYDWVKSYLDAGLALGALLSERADIPVDSREGAALLRARTLGTLNRMRSALADEVAGNPKLDRNLDTLVFAHFDQLAAQWAAAKKRAKATEAKAAKPKADDAAPKADDAAPKG